MRLIVRVSHEDDRDTVRIEEVRMDGLYVPLWLHITASIIAAGGGFIFGSYFA